MHPKPRRAIHASPWWSTLLEDFSCTTRYLVGILINYILWRLLQMNITQTNFMNWHHLRWWIPLPSALCIWMVENIGRKKGNLWHCLGVAYSTHPIRHIFYDETYLMTGMLVVSAFALDYFSKKWRQKPLTRRLQKGRRVSLTVVVCIYLLMLSIYFYLNCTIKDSDGDKAVIYETLIDVILPWWTDLVLNDPWQHVRHYGDEHVRQQDDEHGQQKDDEHARQQDDEHDQQTDDEHTRQQDDEVPNDERFKNLFGILNMLIHSKAFTILELHPTATPTEVKNAWRTLSKQYHPDKVKDETLKRVAQEKFVQIQAAHEMLSKIKKRRILKNKNDNSDL